MDVLRFPRPRRAFRSIVLLLSMGLAGCSEQIDPDLGHMAPAVDVALPDSPVDLSTLLPALEQELQARGNSLRPPVSEAELERLQQALPCRLPDTLARLYRWHDGVDRIIPSYDWLPLAQVVADYQAIQDLQREIGIPEAAGWPRTRLPILRLDGQEYIALDCSTPDRGALLHNFNESPEWDPRYRGLGHFLQVTLSAYERDAYAVRDGDVEERPLLFAQAFRQHAHPQELAALEGNWSRVAEALAHGSALGLRAAESSARLYPHERYVAVLVHRLEDPDPEVVWMAAYILGELRAQDAEPALARQLSHDSSKVRNFVAGALASLDHIDSRGGTVERLIALLEDPDDLVRISAIEALATARSSSAVAPLVSLLERSRPGLQQYVVRTLGTLRDRSALAALQQLRAQLAAQPPEPDRGGMRASDPPPQRLLAMVDEAVRKIQP